MSDTFSEALSRVSKSPGVYLMKDESGGIIYVGKARNLKKRLSSYFTNQKQHDPKTQVLVKKIDSFDTIVTETENEALILESNLIKRHRPRYNVIYKDDKRYLCLRLDIQNEYPILTTVRKMDDDGAVYFGPFPSSGDLRRTVKFIHKTFKLRKCTDKNFKGRTRPCINYQMDRCLGPCCLEIDRGEYEKNVKEVVLFLKGRTPELIGNIRKEMKEAAEKREYEFAAGLRDKMFALEKIVEKQVSVTSDLMDRDVLGLAAKDNLTVITALMVRGGFLLGARSFQFRDVLSPDDETLGEFIRQYYTRNFLLPGELLLPARLNDKDLLEEALRKIKGKKVSLFSPERGEKRRLINMANLNAKTRCREITDKDRAGFKLMERLGRSLAMEKPPARVECFDNSNISGTEPVAGMVVFVNGNPEKASYRKYKIKSVSGHDDYAYMEEALSRRYAKGEEHGPFPDILMVDGGKGQISIAVSVVKSLGLEGKFRIIGIAKKDEKKGETEDKIYLPNRSNPLNLANSADILLFLQRVRDEAHRFAIGFHRKRRGKAFLSSVLDSVPGVGKKRKMALLTHFGSVEKIRQADPDEISRLPGMNRKTAEAVVNALSNPTQENH